MTLPRITTVNVGWCLWTWKAGITHFQGIYVNAWIREHYSHLTEVFALDFILQGRLPCQCHSRLWSLAGCLVTAQLVPSIARLHRSRNTTGEKKCKPQVRDMNIPDASAERPHYCHGRHCESKGTVFRMEGCVLLLIKEFLITAWSWWEHSSVVLWGMSSSKQFLLIHGLRAHCHLLTRLLYLSYNK